MPKVSICIPAYNSAKYIGRTIESILSQTFDDFELIIVDDVSSDNTCEVITSFKDERIRFFKNEKNQGLVGNWNVCMNYATGEYIHYLCGDDVIYPECIAKKVKILDENDNVALVFSASHIINENDKIIFSRRYYKKDRQFNGKSFLKKSFRTKNIYGEPSNVLFRKNLIERAGLFESSLCYSPDWEYWMRLSLYGDVSYIDDYLMSFRISDTSETGKLLTSRKSELKADDQNFCTLVKNNPEMNITDLDVCMHKVAITLRSWAKLVFMFLKH